MGCAPDRPTPGGAAAWETWSPRHSRRSRARSARGATVRSRAGPPGSPSKRGRQRILGADERPRDRTTGARPGGRAETSQTGDAVALAYVALSASAGPWLLGRHRAIFRIFSAILHHFFRT